MSGTCCPREIDSSLFMSPPLYRLRISLNPSISSEMFGCCMVSMEHTFLSQSLTCSGVSPIYDLPPLVALMRLPVMSESPFFALPRYSIISIFLFVSSSSGVGQRVVWPS